MLSIWSAVTFSVAAVESFACRGQLLMHVMRPGYGDAKLSSPKTEQIRPGIETVVVRHVSFAGAITTRRFPSG